MYSKSERLLIFRFLFSKKTDGYISIFSWFSIVGITLGVAAIIVVMSVMNGFRQELTKRLIGINSHINIYSHNNTISLEEINIIKDNLSTNDYLYILQLIETNGLIIKNERSKGVLIRGYDYKDQDHYLSNAIIKGDFFDNKKNNIIVGDALASSLKVKVGDKIKLAIPKSDKTILGNIPRFKTLIIKGIFDFGMYEYDSNLVFISLELSRKLLLIEDNIFNRVEFYLYDPLEVNNFKKIIDSKIEKNDLNFYSLSWIERNSSLMNALKVEKNVMLLILTLIILVASMNIISGLIIFVKEKNKDIGILKTIGLSNFSIIKIFMSIGLLIGIIGTFFGGLIGIIFSLNISSIQAFLEKLFDTNLFSKEIYYLSSLPARLDKIEVFYVILISLVICLIATIFPAYRSSIIDPVKSLKND